MGIELKDSDFFKLVSFVLEDTSEQEIDAGRSNLVQVKRLGEILERLGLRLSRSALRSADSWRYEQRSFERSEERFAFTVGELYVLLQTARDVQAAHQSCSLWRTLTQLLTWKTKPAVFLGGTCSATTWRQNVVVPFCRANDFNYFNPQVPARSWTPALIHVEERAKLESSAFIFYVSSAARSLTSMIEIAYLIAQRKNLIAVVSRKPVRVRRSKGSLANDLVESGTPPCTPTHTDSASPSRSVSSTHVEAEEQSDEDDCDDDGDEECGWVTAAEQDELASARDALVRLAERNGYPVFESLQEALKSCTPLIRERADVTELVGRHAVLPLELVAAHYRDRLRRLHSAFFSTTANSDRIPFAQAYCLLQQLCAEENVSCIRSPHCSAAALLQLLNSITPTCSSTQTSTSASTSASVTSSKTQSRPTRLTNEPDCLREASTPFIRVQCATPSSNQAPVGLVHSLLSLFVRRSDNSTDSYCECVGVSSEDERRVSFDECCFLFAWLLECERDRRQNDCLVLDSLSHLAQTLRCMLTYVYDGFVWQAGATPSNSSGSYYAPANVHLRGSTDDSSVFDELLLPLLAQRGVSYCLGAEYDERCRSRDRSNCERRRSRSASRERQLPDLVRMTRLSRSACTIDSDCKEAASCRSSRCSQNSTLTALGARWATKELPDRNHRLTSPGFQRFRYRCPFADARLLVFAFSRRSKSVVEMLQCALCIGEDAAVHRRVLLFVEMFEAGDAPDGELLNNAALKDYNRVRMYLLSMAKAHQHGSVRIASSRADLAKLLANELANIADPSLT